VSRLWIPAAAMLLLGAMAYSQEKQPAKTPEFKIPPEEASRENPVKPTPAGLTEGKKYYNLDCQVCHGDHGDGKGDLAADLKTKMPDWRDPATLEKMTDGELFYIVSKGKGEMPEDSRLKPELRWELVNYIRTFAKKDSPATAPAKKP